MSIPVPGSRPSRPSRPRIRANELLGTSQRSHTTAPSRVRTRLNPVLRFTRALRKGNTELSEANESNVIEMRKVLLLLLAVASLATAGAAADRANPAAAASQTVTISKTGFKPTSVSITIGDTVVFSNIDTVAHTVEFKPTTGIHCTAALPLTLQAAKSASCTFANTGKFNFSDPAGKGKNFRGTVTVAKAPAASITATPATLVYGRKVTLAGKLASGQAGQSLQLLAQQCGAATSSPLATVTTTTGGAYTYQATPLMQTGYTVKFKNSTSSAATVKVQPGLKLSKVGRHRYALRVLAAQSFAGKSATFQRYRSTLKRWVKVKRVLLKANTTGVAPTVISSAKFRSSLRAKLRVRVVLGQAQVGTCYLAGRSNTIRS
jgi:plastocyanin